MRYLAIFCLSIGSIFSIEKPLVTYSFSGGRFGDNLLSYIHSKYLCYKYETELIYRSFPYSDDLMLSKLENKPKKFRIYKMKSVSSLSNLDTLFRATRKKIIYEIPYFPDFKEENSKGKDAKGNPWQFFPLAWKDPAFREELRKNIRPIEDLSLIYPPSGSISVALHVRRGGGFDAKDAQIRDPLKFPPDSFYIRELGKLISYFPNEWIYVYVFTDDPNPSQIATSFQKKFSIKNITFEARSGKHFHDKAVLEDFFSFQNFDILIHPQSNFSYIPSQIFDFIVTIMPMHFIFDGNRIEIDQIERTVSYEKSF